jgi:dihydroorotate dehydrogenase electron transfer subunit
MQIAAKIKANTRVGQHCYKLALAAPAVARNAAPGNFLMVKVSGNTDPLLRRPLSIHSVDSSAGVVELLYEVVGTGTRILSQKKTGERVSVIGPLGNGFSFSRDMKRRHAVIVAGGMGAAPLLFLAQRIKADCMTVLIGARTRQQLLCISDFKKLGCDVSVATDDASSGFHGRVTELLEDILARNAGSNPVLYGCGPEPMLKAMALLCRKHRLHAQVSLEAHMACGIGACLGCVVQTKQGLSRVCKEGPVFEISDLVW